MVMMSFTLARSVSPFKNDQPSKLKSSPGLCESFEANESSLNKKVSLAWKFFRQS